MAQIDKLIQGYKDFYKLHFQVDKKLYEDLAKSQNPQTLIIACSDSRADPAIITSADAGDIFAIRNVANLVPPYQPDDHGLHGVSAALEFAVRYLEIKNIVILGHSNCAGIRALVDSKTSKDKVGEFIDSWVKIANKAKETAVKHDEDKYHVCEKEGILVSLENLMTFPWIKKRVDAGSITLHGWYFCVSDGSLNQYNNDSKQFESVL